MELLFYSCLLAASLAYKEGAAATVPRRKCTQVERQQLHTIVL